MDTPEKTTRKKRMSLSDTKKSLELRVRGEVESRLKAEMKRLLARKTSIGNSAITYSVQRYADDRESEYLQEYLGSYNKSPTKTLPVIEECKAAISDAVVKRISDTLLDPERLQKVYKLVDSHLEIYIQRFAEKAASDMAVKYLKNILAKYETEKLLEVEIGDPEEDKGAQ